MFSFSSALVVGVISRMAHPVTSVGALLAEVFRFSGLWICTTGPDQGAVNGPRVRPVPGRSFSSDILGFISSCCHVSRSLGTPSPLCPVLCWTLGTDRGIGPTSSPKRSPPGGGDGYKINLVPLLKDERSEDGLGRPKPRDLSCRGIWKGFPEEGSCDPGIEK